MAGAANAVRVLTGKPCPEMCTVSVDDTSTSIKDNEGRDEGHALPETLQSNMRFAAYAGV